MQERKILPEEDLLQIYLSLPRDQRDRRFTDTSLAADMIGKSQRTIQFWIGTGAIKAVLIGGRFKVDINSLREHLRISLERRSGQ